MIIWEFFPKFEQTSCIPYNWSKWLKAVNLDTYPDKICLIFLASVFKLLFKLCCFGMSSFLCRFKVEMVMWQSQMMELQSWNKCKCYTQRREWWVISQSPNINLIFANVACLSNHHIIISIIIIRVCIHSWQRNSSLDRSHRRLCLVNLDHTGTNCLVRLSLHLIFLVQSLWVHSVALMASRLSDSCPIWPAHLCFTFLIALMILLTPVSWWIQVFCFWSRRVMPSTMRSILCCATTSLSIMASYLSNNLL